MKMQKGLITVLMAVLLVFGMAGGALAAWGTKELETEKIAVTFAREVERGGYKILTTEELKGWMDQKKPMLVVDTMPYEASYKKQHVPGAVQMEFPIPEMTQLDDKTREALEKLLGPDKDQSIVFYCGFKTPPGHSCRLYTGGIAAGALRETTDGIDLSSSSLSILRLGDDPESGQGVGQPHSCVCPWD